MQFEILSVGESVGSCVQGPVVLSRDHHDVGGTDSPFRETSNIEDGSMFCAGGNVIIYVYVCFVYAM